MALLRALFLVLNLDARVVLRDENAVAAESGAGGIDARTHLVLHFESEQIRDPFVRVPFPTSDVFLVLDLDARVVLRD